MSDTVELDLQLQIKVLNKELDVIYTTLENKRAEVDAVRWNLKLIKAKKVVRLSSWLRVTPDHGMWQIIFENAAGQDYARLNPPLISDKTFEPTNQDEAIAWAYDQICKNEDLATARVEWF